MPGRAPRLARSAVVATLTLTLSACALLGTGVLRDTDHVLAGRTWDPVTKLFVDAADVQRRIAAAHVVLLGETHDNPEHHRLQRQIIDSRVAAGVIPMLLMEQFDRDQQATIDDSLRKGGDVAALMRGWDATQYRGILETAVNAGLALRGANLPRAQLRPVVREGFATLPAGDAERLALDAAWDSQRESFMTQVIEASHCGKVSASLRDGLVRAQRLRDATLADSVLETGGQPVVFILGRGHARRDVGVPRYLAVRRPELRVLSIGMVEVLAGNTDPARYETTRVADIAPYDLVIFTARAARTDPCLAFGAR